VIFYTALREDDRKPKSRKRDPSLYDFEEKKTIIRNQIEPQNIDPIFPSFEDLQLTGKIAKCIRVQGKANGV
jgi:hypothetical protein